MATLAASDREERHTLAFDQPSVDLETVRRRVEQIKSSWSPETARARAEEGERRRQQLEFLLLDLMTETSESEESCDLEQHGLSLVG